MAPPADPVIATDSPLEAARRLREIGHSDALIVAARDVAPGQRWTSPHRPMAEFPRAEAAMRRDAPRADIPRARAG